MKCAYIFIAVHSISAAKHITMKVYWQSSIIFIFFPASEDLVKKPVLVTEFSQKNKI